MRISIKKASSSAWCCATRRTLDSCPHMRGVWDAEELLSLGLGGSLAVAAGGEEAEADRSEAETGWFRDGAEGDAAVGDVVISGHICGVNLEIEPVDGIPG